MKRGTLPIIAAFGIIACVEILPHVWAGVALPAKTDANRIQGKKVEAPNAGDDGSALVYINASSAYKHRPNAAASVAGKLDEATFAAYTSQDRLPTSIFAAYTSIERAGGAGTWGSIAGTLENQTDLHEALGNKVDASVFNAYTSIDRSGVSAETFTNYTSQDRVTVTTFSRYTSANRSWGTIGGTLSDQTDLQNALNAKQATVTGGATTITGSDLTASRALVSNTSGKVATSSVTSTELSYLSGVTSSVQTQFTGKIGTSASFGGDVSGTYNAIVVGDDSHNHTSSTIPSNSFTAAGLVTSGAGNASKVWKTDASGNPAWRDDLTGSSPTFDTVGGGTNTSSTMTLGSGGTLTYSGTGVVNASKYKGETGPSAVEFAYLSDLESAILEVNDVVNNLTVGGTTVPLSAEQGKTLNTAFVNYTSTDRLARTSFTSYTSAHKTADDHLQYHTDARGDARYAAKAHALQHYTSNGTDRIPDATEVSAGLLKPLWYKLLSAMGFIVFLDNYAVGDGVANDTTAIGAAIAEAIATKKPVYAGAGKTYATNGGYVVDDPITIIGNGATFKLTANATLFDIGAQEDVQLSGFKVKVPDANTASVIKLTTSYDRNVGRGWGPLHGYKLSDLWLYCESAEGWTPTTGVYPGIVTTEGAWTGIELFADTTGGRTGHNYFKFENIRMDFPYYGFKVVKTGSYTAWSAGHHFENIVIHGFQSAIYAREVNFNDNTFTHLMLHPLRDDNVVGLDWDGWANSNTIGLNTFHDSGWNGQTRGEFKAYSFGGGFGNLLTGYFEVSVGTPPTGTDRNTIIADTWVTDKSLWPAQVGTTSNIATIRGPLGIDIEAENTAALAIFKQYTTQNTANIMNRYDVYGDIARSVFRRANGTKASPTKTLASDTIFALGGRPYSGSAFSTFNTAQITALSEENSDLGWQSGLRFWVTNHGDSSAYPFLALLGPRRMIVNAYANTDDGVNTVQVTGTVKATAFTDGTTSKTITELWENGGSGVSLASVAAGGTVSCSHTTVIITSGAAGADTTLPASCTAGKIITVKNSSGAAQDIIAASGYIDDTPGLEWRIPSTGTSSFISEGTTLGWQAIKHPIPDCDNATTSKLLYDVTTNTFTCGTDQTGGGITVNDSVVGITDAGGGNEYIYITEDNAEVARITGGKLGVGTTTPSDQITASLAGTGAIAAINTSAYGPSSGALVKVIADPGSAVDAADRRLGGVLFAGAVDTNHAFGYGASIEAFSDGAYSSGTDTPAYLVYKTAPDGGTRAERLRIKSNGLIRFVPMAQPSVKEEGDCYFDSTSHKLTCWDGSAWQATW